MNWAMPIMPLAITDERPLGALTSSRGGATDRAMTKPYIAIVDDDAAFASYLQTFLSLRGYDARCYDRGDELLAAMKQSDVPDAVLLDVMMPGLDGMATLRALKASRPEAQVIMLSGRNQASVIVEAVQAGATDYVVKPDDPEGLGEIELDVAIKNAIEKTRLVSELSELRQQLTDNEDQAVWGNSDGMRRITTVIEQVGDSDVAVLIRGESGVGKELVSRAIHQQSTRRQRPFVKVNCAALPAELLESELFGHEKGAFTGAAATRIGKFEQADGGTLMLDEIGELTPALQAKLLARAAGRGVHQTRRQQTRAGRCPRRRGDQPRSREDADQRYLPRGSLLSSAGHRAGGSAASRAPRRDSDADGVVHRALLAQIQAPVAASQPQAAAALPRVRLAREHPRARKHHQAPRHPAGRADRLRGNRTQLASGRCRDPPRSQPRPSRHQSQPRRRRPPAFESGGARSESIPDATEPDVVELEAPEPENGNGGSLAAVARAASMKAERALIEKTLNQVHWNRRKASQILGVSYKTLLNKIKECSITRD